MKSPPPPPPRRQFQEFGNFVLFNDLHDENAENGAHTEFRLPSRLLERLQKRKQQAEETKTEKSADSCNPNTTRVLQSMENSITPLFRRETFVCHNKLPTKVMLLLSSYALSFSCTDIISLFLSDLS